MSRLKQLSVSNFNIEVPSAYIGFVTQAHELLVENGYKPKFELKRHGLSALYKSPATKGLALQLIIRDNTLYMYLYNIFLHEHNGYLENLPLSVIDEFAKYRNCIDSCEPVCTVTRLSYTIGNTLYRKCVVGRLLFTVNKELAAGVLSVLWKYNEKQLPTI
ncbi:MAG: hypothetical protein FWC95_01700 [Defluviitaleaceae bacterium]|nr:hypothetical protein [Defluviitaleaceae bacterium]